MTDISPDSFSEHDLRRALAGRAATVRPRPDRSRLDDGIRRADRIRTVRAATLSGVSVLAVAFGVLNLSGPTESSTVDVVDRPDVVDPTPDLPEIGNPDGEIVLVEATTTTSTTTTTAAPEPAESSTLPDKPDHLLTPPSTTTVSPVATTTTPPPTTVPPPTVPPTTTTPAPTTTAGSTLAANVLYGSCDADPPFDIYSGTAAPGAVISITSPWSAPMQTTAADDGTWELEVEFPDSPIGESFTVSITDGISTKGIGFVRTG
ncbi:MAG: hypothetical protein AAF081_03340 [Actinomycetota bacterium]